MNTSPQGSDKKRSRAQGLVALVCLCCFWIFFCSCPIAFVALLSSLPKVPYGNFLIGNSDVVLVSTFNSFTINHVVFNQTGNSFRINFYQDLCSDIKMMAQLFSFTIQVNATANMQYRVYESYLTKRSEVHYIITALDTVSNSSCVGNVYVFESVLTK